jgi:hypothetical protein
MPEDMLGTTLSICNLTEIDVLSFSRLFDWVGTWAVYNFMSMVSVCLKVQKVA